MFTLPEPPPSYDSLFGQVRAAREELSSTSEFFKKLFFYVFSRGKIITVFEQDWMCKYRFSFFRLLHKLFGIHSLSRKLMIILSSSQHLSF